MITYSEIENLPADHPKVKQFEKELADMDAAYMACGPDNGPAGADEGGYDHFNRYQAGDR
jgi:hypothetical protein